MCIVENRRRATTFHDKMNELPVAAAMPCHADDAMPMMPDAVPSDY
jgi:hypothetical protein